MRKKKEYVIDKISEDTFYENILLGLPRFLRKSPFISHIKCERLPAVPLKTLKEWETQNIELPEDIRDFFLSTNGFSFSYKFKYDGPNEDGLQILGKIHVKPLESITQMDNSQISLVTEQGRKFLNPKSVVFPISEIDDANWVVLGKFGAAPASYWLYRKDQEFSFLCGDFRTYLKMAVAHLGVDGWQQAAASGAFLEWTLEVYRILAPGMTFQPDSGMEKCKNNVLDPAIFNETVEKEESEEVKRVETVVKPKPVVEKGSPRRVMKPKQRK